MKLSKIKEKLRNKIGAEFSIIKTEFRDRVKNGINREVMELASFNEEVQDLNKLKIIGITGSKGKSSTAFIIHEYLKSIGKRSILHSSIKVDSPATYIMKDAACDSPIYNEQTLLDIVEGALAYDAEYLVLEVNDTAITKGLVNDIDFDIKVLTNIDPNHNLESYTSSEYFETKRSFFSGSSDSICIYGINNKLSRFDFDKLTNSSTSKVLFGNEVACLELGLNSNSLDCLLYNEKNNLDSNTFTVRLKNDTFNIKSSLILPYNNQNVVCGLTVLDALNVLDKIKFLEFIKNITIPGREEVIKVNNRFIVIGLSIEPVMKYLANFKSSIRDIKVVVGAIGTGFYTWDDTYTNEHFKSRIAHNRKRAMEYVGNYADFAYLTSNDPAKEDPYKIALEMKSTLDEYIPSIIETDRKEAIRKAIMESRENDLIYIAGRGNRKVFCNSGNTIILFTDKEVVEDVIEELGWK